MCSCAKHFTFTVRLSTKEYKLVPATCYESILNDVNVNVIYLRKKGVMLINLLVYCSCIEADQIRILSVGFCGGRKAGETRPKQY